MQTQWTKLACQTQFYSEKTSYGTMENYYNLAKKKLFEDPSVPARG
jgi:hypothetical protein